MKFRFVGQYTGGQDSFTFYDGEGHALATFNGREASEVKDAVLAAKLARHPEFKSVGKKVEAEPEGPPALTGLNKADLLEVAEAEGVEVEEGATNKEIVAAIEAARK